MPLVAEGSFIYKATHANVSGAVLVREISMEAYMAEARLATGIDGGQHLLRSMAHDPREAGKQPWAVYEVRQLLDAAEPSRSTLAAWLQDPGLPVSQRQEQLLRWARDLLQALSWLQRKTQASCDAWGISQYSVLVTNDNNIMMAPFELLPARVAPSKWGW